MQTDRAAPSLATRRGLVGLEQRVLARLRQLRCPPGVDLVVGFSGGADSLALAAVLGRIADRVCVRPVLAHVDHRLRSSSGEEQRRAEQLADALGLPFRALSVPGDVTARHPGVGTEEAARRERYRALAGVVTETDAAVLALAHHREDQAETVLLHLLRGAGVSGARGMAERTDLVVPWWDGEGAAPVHLTLWRPFLDEPRATVRAYVAGLGLAPVEDPSNDAHGPRRNALRHEALPLLERISPGAAAALARFARLAAEDDATLEALAETVAARAVTLTGDLDPARLSGEPAAVRRRVVRRWLRERTGCRSLSADRADAVLGLAMGSEGGRRVEVGEGMSVVTLGGVLRVTRDAAPAEEGVRP